MARRGLALGLVRTALLSALAALAILASAIAFFPAERLAPAVVARLEAATGARVALEKLSLGLAWTGPYADLEGLALRWPDDSALAIDSLHVAPELSLAWLRGEARARVASAAPFGRFEGVASLAGIAGELRGFDLAELPAAWFGTSGAPVDGRLDAVIEAERLAGQWHGAARFEGADGVLALPGLPVAIPYESVRGHVGLDALGNLSLDSVAVAGPLASATASGTIAAGYAGPASGPIDVMVEVTRLDPALVPLLAEYGLPAADARRLHVGGTPDRVELREYATPGGAPLPEPAPAG